MSEPHPVPIVFATHEIEYAQDMAVARHTTGSASKTLDSGFDAVGGDLIGVLAEMAVCIAYGVRYEEFVTVYKSRPGAIPDVIYEGYKISVKGTPIFTSPHLIIPDYDVNNDIYVLVSVQVDKGYAQLRGWIPRDELLTYQTEEWKWYYDRPGAARKKLRRYVPLGDLRQCRPVASRQELLIR